MKKSKLAAALLMSGALTTNMWGVVTQTIGTGSSVTSADRTATFDTLTVNGTDLSAYQEDSLDIFVADTLYVDYDFFNGGATTALHYGSSGNNSYVTIRASDAASLYAVEFLLGTGNSEVGTTVIWETYSGAILT